MAHLSLERGLQHVRTAAEVAGTAHMLYQDGKGLWGLGQAVLPYAAMLL
jgi:hypothetical protein